MSNENWDMAKEATIRDELPEGLAITEPFEVNPPDGRTITMLPGNSLFAALRTNDETNTKAISVMVAATSPQGAEVGFAIVINAAHARLLVQQISMLCDMIETKPN